MAEVLVVGKKISEMELVTDISGNEKIPTGVVGDRAVTTGQLVEYLNNNGRSVWGRIDGDITNQVDLQNQFAQERDTLKSYTQEQVSQQQVALQEHIDATDEVFKYARDNGSALPYKEGIAYEENAVVVKNGELQQWKGGVWRSAVAVGLSGTIQTFNTTEAGVDPVTGVADGTYFNVRSPNDESYVDEYQNDGGVPTPTGKSYPSSAALNNIPHNNLKDRDADEAHPASAIYDSSGLNQQEINDARPNLKQFGATGNGVADDTAAFHRAITENGGAHLTHGKYLLSCTSFNTLSNDVVFTADEGVEVVLTSGTADHAFFVSSSKVVSLDGIKFSHTGGITKRVFRFDPVAYLDLFSTTNCGFKGDISLAVAGGSKTQDPTVTPYGFKKLVFNYNKVNDVGVRFFVLVDFPHYDTEVHGNKVRNFRTTFINFGITNATTNGRAVTLLNNFYITENDVRCDDATWSIDNADYYCFAMIEGYSVSYLRNHVEGIKATLPDTPVYDAYLSCANVVSEGNTYKNNANFAPSPPNNWIFKGKADEVEGSQRCKKVWKDNIALIEDDWIERNGQTSCVHRIANIGVVNAGDVTIKDNVINVHTLEENKRDYARNFAFINNSLRAKKARGSAALVRVSPFNSVDCTLTLANNTVLIDSSDQSVFLFDNDVVPRMKWRSAEIYGNTVNVVDFDGAATNPSVLLLHNVSLGNAYLARNKVGSSVRYPFYGCSFESIDGDGVYSVANKASGISLSTYANYTVYGRSAVSFEYRGVISQIVHAIHKNIDFTPLDNTTLQYVITVTVETQSGLTEIEFKYALLYSSGVYTVSFIDSADASASAVVADGTQTGTLVKSVVSGTGGLALTAELRNGSFDGTFRINGIPSTNSKVKVKVNCF